MGKKRFAYILSTRHGTVQIGDTVFQPATGAEFRVTMKGTSKCPKVLVDSKSMKSAKDALKKIHSQ